MKHIQLKSCPICDGSDAALFIGVKDRMITGEKFAIQQCVSCGFLFTSPKPAEEKIESYYEGENYISHSSSKKGLINGIYNLVRTYTLRKKINLLLNLNVGKDLLDVGTGTGHFLNACNKKGFSVSGIEPNENARIFAKQKFNINIFPAEKLASFEERSKDVVTMWHVLEHIYHLKRDVEKLIKILRPTGKIIIAVPNPASYDAQFYKEFWAGYDVPRHLYHFKKKDIENLANQFDLKIEKILPMKFDSFYVSMLSEKYRGGSIFKAFLIGLISNLKSKEFGYSSQIYVLKKKK